MSATGAGKKTVKKKKTIGPPNLPAELDPAERIKGFDEIKQPYTEEIAIAEAQRCLQCPKPRCSEGCPVHTDIPGVIKLILEKKYKEAVMHIRKFNTLPSICSRVCPHEEQCQGHCVLAKRFGPVQYGMLERFVTDYARQNYPDLDTEVAPPNGKKVAVIGSGPAGLTVANDLVKLGYDITVYEAFHHPGGILTYGIPAYRLPKDVVEFEVKRLEKMGVKFVLGKKIGKDITVKDLKEKEGFDAIFIGIGTTKSRKMGIPGEDLEGVVVADDFLKWANMKYSYNEEIGEGYSGKNVIVVGGGNVAMDAARVALRNGAEKVTIVYRRAREQMPAADEEIREAEDEGVNFMLLHNPVEFLGDGNGKVRGARLIKMRLGEPDSSGRARPIPIEGSEFDIECDMAILAIGNMADATFFDQIPELELNRKGYIKVDEEGRTNIPYIFAGGDIIYGPWTVVKAVDAGRKAAKGIHKYLSGN